MITARTARVTPAMAQEFLNNAAPNRSLYKQVLERYATDMANSRWQLNGEPLIFSSKGQLMDGQHRLTACVMSNTPFNTLIVEGVDETAFRTLGNGQIRSNSDVLYMMGEKDSHKLAGAVRWIHMYNQDPPMKMNIKTTHQDAIGWLARFPEIRQSLELARSAQHVMSVTVLAATHCMGAKVFNKTISDSFVESVANGANLGLSNPARILRERMLQDRAVSKGGPKLPSTTIFALTIKAFNFYGLEEKISSIRWIRGEPFPKLSKSPTEVLRSPSRRKGKVDIDA